MKLTNKGMNINHIIVKGLNKKDPSLFYIIDKNRDRVIENAASYAYTIEEARRICKLQNELIF